MGIPTMFYMKCAKEPFKVLFRTFKTMSCIRTTFIKWMFSANISSFD